MGDTASVRNIRMVLGGDIPVSAVEGLTDALAATATDATVVKLTGAQTVAGVKTFSSAPVVPAGSFAVAATTGLQAALDAKAPSTGIAQSAVTNLVSDLAAKALNTEAVNTVATSGAAQTIPDVTTATINRITLTANCTFTFPTAGAGKSFTLVLVQGGAGSFLATWPGTAKWAGAVAPTLSTAVGKIDYLSFVCTDGTNWAGFVAGLDMR